MTVSWAREPRDDGWNSLAPWRQVLLGVAWSAACFAFPAWGLLRDGARVLHRINSSPGAQAVLLAACIVWIAGLRHAHFRRRWEWVSLGAMVGGFFVMAVCLYAEADAAASAWYFVR